MYSGNTGQVPGQDSLRISRRRDQQYPRHTKQKILKIAGMIIGGLMFCWSIYFIFSPRMGTIHFGICRVFSERYIAFPSTMRVRDVEYYGLTVRVYVTHIDSSGQYRYDQFLCEFQLDNLEIQKVEVNRKVVDEEMVTEFNRGIDAILLNPPDLTLPPRLSDLSIKELWHGKY